MSILGAHQSIAGGYHRAVEAAVRDGCDCVQLFSHNTNQWHAKPITPAEAKKFRQTLAESGVGHPLIHDSYLINLASPDDALWRRSIAAMVEELCRAEILGIPHVVMHPGSFTTSSEDEGIGRICAAMDAIHTQSEGCPATLLLETTAGQGNTLGWRFEHLRAILDGVRQPERLGVCFDTCHVFAAGYPLSPRRAYLATMRKFDATIGLDRIRAFHLNDSRGKLGSRLDRHAHIGHGEIGLEGFRLLLNDRRFRHVPMYLETPKENKGGENWDVINLRVLRGLGE